ncbi:hypothetical protein PPSIR1_03723 [Plesiocystis pacifica SIR-1]|uniref:DUF2135 domain-containing protein n=1 Tax=Plesiocystis pacifica SIR-1 TaxID=391625 RepID=A6G4A3_9BACT|nr:tetratricopeptide repeat protein [Plesiocystis pacifica]EDM79215.1 hypothetical protein PPSIR1_03723 [Plesiocystis pacifica SIR-1]
MTPSLWPALWMSLALVFAPPKAGASAPETSFEVTGVAERPEREASEALDAQIAELRETVAAEPRERRHRHALIRALMDAGELDEALVEAEAWREIDAYNLIVVRLIGDIHSELGNQREALRTYSAVTELLPEDPEAQRALASVLEVQGDLDNAYARMRVATQLRPKDLRLAFELADLALRRGQLDEARAGLEAIVAHPEVPEALEVPAKQRLAQVYSNFRRASAGATERAEWTARVDALELPGGSENDVKVYLSWDTDRTDVDLWVINPRGEKVFYSHKRGSLGGVLFHDVTTGYGPESYTLHDARAGTYAVEVHYFGNNGGSMKEARGEVLVVTNEGRPDEQQHTFHYVLPKRGDKVRVAEIAVAE